MKFDAEDTQVFIVRLWRERREIEGARPVLRGTVEHVASGERRSITKMDDVTAFVQPYIEAMDADAEQTDRFQARQECSRPGGRNEGRIQPN